MTPKRILFVCLGNICRSPSAQGVMQQLVNNAQLSTYYNIDSAGMLSYHQGELPDARMREHALKRGLVLNHPSRPVISDDFDNFDYIIGMDDSNIAALQEMAPSVEVLNKIHRMTDFAIHTTMDHVPDPYYGGARGFDLVLDLLEDCCQGLLNTLEEKG